MNLKPSAIPTALCWIFPLFAVVLLWDAGALAQGGDATGQAAPMAARRAPPAYGNLIFPLLLMVLVGPPVIRFGLGAIANHRPAWGRLFLVNGASAIAAAILGVIVMFAAGGRGGLPAMGLIVIAYAVIGSFVFGRSVSLPGGEPMGAKRGLMVAVLAASAVLILIILLFVITQL